VREHAEARLYGNIGALKHYRDNKPGAVIAVCGCMMQQQDAAKKLMRRFPFVNLTFGANDIHRLPELLDDVLIAQKRARCVDDDESIIEGLPCVRSSVHSAFVNIMYGCNNFCTYCVVPYVRGRERSRKSADVIAEIQALCSAGTKEITLLGQNVNSYGAGDNTELSFPELLERIDEDTDIERLRFMTSHPKDLTGALISCYGRLKSLCEHIHLPVQSGSDTVLERMRRRYTRAHYLDLVAQLRQCVPDIAIIVGFPGETEAEFEQTMSLVDTVKFDAAYTFAYSSRRLTKAADMPGHLDKQTKAGRLARLNSMVAAHVREKNEAYLGKTVEVLVDSASKRKPGEISGRTRSAKTVNFHGDAQEMGCLVNVTIDKVMVHTLRGKRETKGEGQ
jgi:tRNA-2-methylthio-N6-dimethylallyladenosine synthase